jgi:hypothetical protein
MAAPESCQVLNRHDTVAQGSRQAGRSRQEDPIHIRQAMP